MAAFPDTGLLVRFRRELHRYPELSGREERTAARVTDFLRVLDPDGLFENIGGKGVAAKFKGSLPGPRVLLRAELDALPVNESNRYEYSSAFPGVSHACGHDGHMAILAGVANYFSKERPCRGELITLFQPSEEDGRGACSVISDPLFDSLRPDYAIALHNLPGFDAGRVVLGNSVFSMASTGMIIKLKGRTSHAAEPENGVSPAKAVSAIIERVPAVTESSQFKQFTLATIIYVKIGEIAFGTSPGDATVMVTLRAYDNVEMEKMMNMCEDLVREVALSEGLGLSVEFTEKFPATVNDKKLSGVICKSAGELGLDVKFIDKPFRWSEDFGWFTQNFRGVLFGIGSGNDHPELHNPDFDFPDQIIGEGVQLLTLVSKELFNF